MTDTPGAREARVNEFIDRMLTFGLPADERDRFLTGLKALDDRALQAAGKPFVEATPEQQAALLTALQSEATAREVGGEGQPFFTLMKQLTLVGYYTSEIGAMKELQYVHVAGRYDGDVLLSKAGRAYA
jgi:hypothetical protein